VTFDRPSTASDVAIVDAVPGDAEAILALQRLAYQSEARRYDNWSIPPLVETLDSVREHIERHVVLKAIVDDRLVGSVRGVLTDGICEVGRLIVHPEAQRRGIGAALLDAIEARVSGAAAFELFTGDRSQGNLRLYARHGYVVTHTTPVSAGVSLVFLRKPAGAPAVRRGPP
jgi:GNAT superfamily N-acetyltransferase